jgi:phage baseplate assembly protein W|tara:strand:+ start:404 stop:772 length:369 start_codon:yes stop_codon:yes gene_type:complete
MNAFGVALPVRRDSNDGFVMLKTLKKLFSQNLKMLILTAPGERVMEPNFGVGMRTYLFQNFGQNTEQAIASKIREQASIYLPAIKISSISFNSTDIDSNRLGIAISYSIPDINIKDFIEITI